MAQHRIGERTRLWCMSALLTLASTGFDWPTRADRLLGELAHATDPALRCDLLRLLSQLNDARADQALLEAAANDQTEVRIEALRALAARPSERAFAALTQGLADSEPRVRAQAASSLGRVRAKPALPALTRMLSDTDTSVRVAAAQALGRLGDGAAVIPLATALDDASLEVRVQAATALADLADPNAFAVVLAKLRDPAPELRVAAVEALPRIDSARAEAALLAALDDAAPSVQLAALRALLALHRAPPGLRERLEVLAAHASPRVMAAIRAAREALEPPVDAEKSRQEPLEPAWLKLLEQTAVPRVPQEEALLSALEASLPAGESLAVDPLVVWLRTAQPSHRARIAALIARARPRRSGSLSEFLVDSDPRVRTAIAQALGFTGDASTARALQTALTDPAPQVQRQAALSLAKLSDATSLAALGEALAKADAAAARAPLALAIAGSLERLAPTLTPALRAELTGHFASLVHDRNPALAAVSARALGLLPSAQALEALKRVALSGPVGVRVAALRATISQGSSAEVRALRQAASADPNDQVSITGLTAQWLAKDPLDASSLGDALESSRWPRGPVAAFVLASLEPTNPSAATSQQACPELATREPIARANLIAATLRAGDVRCVLDRVVPWLQNSQVWPIRLAAARWLTDQRSRAPATLEFGAALARCAQQEANPHVRAHCAGPATQVVPEEAAPNVDETDAAYRALVLEDGRVLVTAVDAAGEASWPGLRTLSAENPWHWAYSWE